MPWRRIIWQGICRGINESMKKREIAQANFKQGYNCTQSVFLAYAEDFGLDEELALRVSASFGGGMGRLREVCGAVSGMFLVAGLLTGNVDPKDFEGKKRNYQMVQDMAEAYKQKNERHSIICRELLGLDTDQPTVSAAALTGAVPEARTPEYYKKRPCLELIGDACDIIDSFINQ